MIEILRDSLTYLKIYPKVDYTLNDANPCALQPLGFLETDFNYLENYEKILKKEITPEKMNWKQLSTMMTFFSRAERFCTGFHAGILSDGTLIPYYERMLELLEK